MSITNKIKIGLTAVGMTGVIVAGLAGDGHLTFNGQRITDSDFRAIKKELVDKKGNFQSWDEFQLWGQVADFEAKRGKLKKINKLDFNSINNNIN